MDNKRFSFKRVISLVLVISMVVTMLSGCGGQSNSVSKQSNIDISDAEVNTEEIVEETVSEILNDLNDTETIVETLALSTNWEDYQGDLETFVYGLIASELQYRYDVFPACVELLNGTEVYGLAYTDYSECYVSDDESSYCFTAGLIPFVGELDIPEDDFNAGLTLYNLDYTDENASFVLSYGCDPYTEHCVVYNQYLKYGVNERGQIFYEAEEYEREKCDESLGSLYSYDESKFLYDVDMGSYVNVTGSSLYAQIDYSELEAEINKILETQDENLVTIDVESCAYLAQEAVTSYLLSMQEETFLGISVDELVAAAGELDPLECYRITADGIVAIELDYDGGASSLTRWLVGTGCVIVTAVAMVGSVVFIECPPLSALSSAMAGVAIEIFMEVVISGETLDNVNWGKVATAAATGAVSGFLGPYVKVTFSGASYFFVDSSLDGLVGGIEHAVNAWLEGEDGAQIIKSFGYGFALGFAISAGFKAVGAVVEKLAIKIAPSITKLAESVFPKLTNKVSKLSAAIGSAIYALKKTADSSVFHSEYISQRLALRQLERLVENGADDLAKKAMNNLGTDDIVDAKGVPITKDQLQENFNEAENGTVLGYFKKDNEMVEIVKQNGMVGIAYDSSKYIMVALPNGITQDRSANFAAAAEQLKKQWLEDSSSVPESIATAIRNSGIDLEDMEPERLVSIIQSSDWVIHENIDLTTITLVPRWLHDVKESGIPHMGGVGLAKYLKSHMGIEFFDRLIAATATGAVQAAN